MYILVEIIALSLQEFYQGCFLETFTRNKLCILYMVM